MNVKSIAFIDCFAQEPVNNCVNQFVLNTELPCTYHMPSRYGLKTLHQLKKADGYIILGSTSHVTEGLKWHQDLIDFIIPKIESNIPTFGICFGHQLIAHHYGCQVGYMDDKATKKTEVRDIFFKQDSLGFKKNDKLSLAFAHSQVVKSITDDFEVIANSSTNQFEGLKLKKHPYWSFQAHPEASVDFMKDDACITDPQQIKKTLEDGLELLLGFVKQLEK